MAYYQNTGYARNTILTVTKGLHHQSYDITYGFTSIDGNRTYPSLSPEGFALLSDADYERRLADFVERIYYLEPGLYLDCPNLAEGSVIHDPDHCPVVIIEKPDGWAEIQQAE